MLSQRFHGYEIFHVHKLNELNKEGLADTEILLTYGDNMPEELVAEMTSLRWIHSGQAGVDSMPGELLAKMGVFVTNSRGINSVTIAEYVLCMMLNLERNTYRFYEAYKKGIWDTETRLDEITGRTIGVLGLGNVGKEIAKRAKAFDMTVLGMDLAVTDCPFIDQQYRPKDLDTVLMESDYIVICLPMTKETYHTIGEKQIAKMKKQAVIINVGRGAVVETAAVVDALKKEQIRAAILDVLEEEPISQDSPLWKVDNLMITPHIAGDRQASYMPRMMDILCYNLNVYPEFSAMKNPVNVVKGF